MKLRTKLFSKMYKSSVTDCLKGGRIFRSLRTLVDDDVKKICENASAISEEKLAKWYRDFHNEPKNLLAQNVCSRFDPFDVCLSRKTFEQINHVFTHTVENEGRPTTNQKSSGRCWVFAGLNCIRLPFMKENNLEEFEFSQSYLFYWDKIERCNYFLHNIVKTAKRGEPVNGRLVSFLLAEPTSDGGQWDMFVNLITKHGLMPKKCFPESFNSESSMRMNSILKSKLREYAKLLRDAFDAGATEDTLNAKINSMMFEIYKIVGICLGVPPKTFVWEFYDKSKKYHAAGPISPLDFYTNHVKKIFNVEDKVCLVTDPRPKNHYQAAYTIDCLGNVVNGRQIFYNNQPVELLLELVVKSIKAGEPVWFGCEVNKRFAAKQGIQDANIHDFKLLFDVDIQTRLTKADRLIFGESAMSHAMVFTAVSLDEQGLCRKLRVENSWGVDRGDKGYLVMTADWFKEFVFEIVVDKKHVSEDVLKVFCMDPIVLPAWDPMGTLTQ